MSIVTISAVTGKILYLDKLSADGEIQCYLPNGLYIVVVRELLGGTVTAKVVL